jgi:hypothetical protein
MRYEAVVESEKGIDGIEINRRSITKQSNDGSLQHDRAFAKGH